jgi:hypothetical protein
MDDLMSPPGSGGKRCRARAFGTALGHGRPRSPIERLRAEEEEDEDLDNFRQHKRYLAEVRREAAGRCAGGALPAALCSSPAAPTPGAAGSARRPRWP